MDLCERCGRAGASFFYECMECGEVLLCDSCKSLHRKEMKEDE